MAWKDAFEMVKFAEKAFCKTKREILKISPSKSSLFDIRFPILALVQVQLVRQSAFSSDAIGSVFHFFVMIVQLPKKINPKVMIVKI